MSGRKRSRAAFYAQVAAPGAVALRGVAPRPYKRRKRAFVPGRDRVGGYYGRFAGTRGELKFHDVDLDDAVVATVGTITPSINLIAQGTTESERIGRKCTLKSVEWRYQMLLQEQDAVTTPASGDTLRTIIFVDKQANGATAVVLDLLESASWQSFYNLSNQNRFVILFDKLHTNNYAGLASDNVTVVSQALNVKNYSWKKRCNIPLEFSNTTGALTEIRSNNIGVLVISATQSMKLDSKFRLRFDDN